MVQKITNKYVRVSDITVYIKCPRMCYFANKGYSLVKDITPAYLERMILKELALSYGSVFDHEDKFSILNEELDRISNEIRAIYRNELSCIDEETMANSITGVRSCLGNICSNLSCNSDFYAGEFVQDETPLRSEKFGLTGSLDRLIKMNDELLPSIIKTGSMPENGVWQGDRLQLTAHAILVEEKYNSVVERGFVEYARWGKVRQVVIKRHERRKILQIKDKIKKIYDGFMPERSKDAPCEYCGFTGMCEVKSTLASRFF
jgi:CRISPR-associated exonuclease Cas4